MLSQPGQPAAKNGPPLDPAGAADPAGATGSRNVYAQETIPPPNASPLSGASQALLPERFGRYRILQPLGSGGMGAVFLAEDTQLGRRVAIKVPSLQQGSQQGASAELIERFYREARAAATLRHAHICPVYDVGELDGVHFISMAYIEGRPLAEHIHGEKRLPQRQVLLVVRKLALALAQAHKQGIVHRDLKPANVMIDGRGEPVIMDFGLARKVAGADEARLTQSGVILGSPAYMSPEQVEGLPEKITPATDQYSLGVILYEALTGQLPYRGALTAVVAAILTQAPTPLRALRPEIDARVEALCLKMMARSPAARYPTMKAVADQIASILTARTPSQPGNVAQAGQTGVSQASSPEVPATAQPARPPSGPARFVGRKVLMAIGAGLLAPLLLGVTMYFRAGKAVVRVQIDDPAVRVTLQDQTLTVDNAGSPIKVTPGDDNQLVIHYGELKLRSHKFTLKKGENPLIVVTVLDDKLAAAFDGQSIGERPLERPAAPDTATQPPQEAEATPDTTATAKLPGGGNAATVGEEAAIDLLALIDPARDAVHGKWSRDAGGLVSDGGTPFCRLKIPYTPPDEFDFHIEFTARGNNDILQLVARRSCQFTWLMGGWGGKYDAFDIVAGRSIGRDGQGLVGALSRIRRGQRHTATIEVRNRSVAGYVDGQLVVRHPTDYSDLTLPGGWKIERGSLGLGTTFNQVTFHKVQLVPAPSADLSGPFDSDALTSDDWTWSEPVDLRTYTVGRRGLLGDSPLLRGESVNWPPSIFGDQMIFCTSSARDKSKGPRDLLVLQRSSPDSAWGAPLTLPPAINSPADEFCPFITPDGLTLVFVSDRPGGSGRDDLWRSTRAGTSDAWPAPVPLGINTPDDEGLATISADGLTFVFASTRKGGEGESDLWMTTRSAANDAWSTAKNLGPPINGGHREEAPLLSADARTLIFSSDRPGGLGDMDLWISRRETTEDPWSVPVNQSAPVNSKQWDHTVALTFDNRHIVFGSLRGRGGLWVTARVRKPGT